MRYSDDHKAATRKRIIDEASRRFRRDGIDATGLQALMKTLGLTHGGFYAHFSSKDELVQKALEATATRLKTTCNDMAVGDQALPQFIDQYLSPAHRAAPEHGCPLPTMSAELGQHGTPSPWTDAVVRDRLAMMESQLDREDGAQASVAALSTLVGALLLSRSVHDPELSDRILEQARDWLHQQLDTR